MNLNLLTGVVMKNGKKYNDKDAQKILFDLLDGNGGTHVMDLLTRHVNKTIAKFNLSKEETELIRKSYLIQLDNIGK